MTVIPFEKAGYDTAYSEVVLSEAAHAVISCPECEGEPIGVVEGGVLHVIAAHATDCPWIAYQRTRTK